MTTHSALRTVRMAIVSLLFALAALSFLAGGIVNAQTVNSAPTAQGNILQGPPTVVHIVVNQQGQATYSPTQIGVSLREAFTLVNNTKVVQSISGKGLVTFTLAPGGSISLSFNQTGQVQLTLASSNTTLIVNVVPFRA